MRVSLRAQSFIRGILKHIGENPSREGLLDTPKRVVKSWNELFAGYKEDPQKILSTVFHQGTCEEMVILKDIPFQSMCEHHMLPFIGKAHVAYIPDGKVVGLSKLARLVDCFAKRLQIQEQMTKQIADAIQQYLKPRGAAVVVEAHHQCMSCRGIKKHGTTMITSSMSGLFMDNATTRSEFFSLVK